MKYDYIDWGSVSFDYLFFISEYRGSPLPAITTKKR